MSDPITTASQAERHADQARRELAATLEQLKGNLKPKALAGEALAATRARTPGWLLRYWAFAASPAGLGLIDATAASISLTMVKRRNLKAERVAKDRLAREYLARRRFER